MLDILIVGAGPAGLSLAKLLSKHNLSIGILERQPLDAIEKPAYDGREIALTQHSILLLNQMGVTAHFAHDEYAPLNTASVINGNSSFCLHFSPPPSSETGLGMMASNHAIRRGLFQVVKTQDSVEFIPNDGLAQIKKHATHMQITTTSGKQIDCRLLIAADSRFSNTRRQIGIGAEMTDFGRSMMVCRMSHALPHHETAYEIFNYGQTLALLPLANNCSSVVLTLPTPEIEALRSLDNVSFTNEMQKRVKNKLGAMKLVSDHFSYPLVATYAKKFTSNRFALIGDAAVGMHPVTAHGFNLGLSGAETLAKELGKVKDVGSQSALTKFERIHKRETLPLYLGTNAIAKLYADERPPARLIRGAGLRIANTLTPIKRKVVNRLIHA